MIREFLSIAVIIGSLPNNIQNGQTADAVPLMADLNFIVNQVNANAAPLANTALLNAANSFTAVQSGLAATSPANFPIASQVQNFSFNTLSSVLGTNSISARVSALTLGAYVSGQVFTFLPTQPNIAGNVSMRIDSLGSIAVTKIGNPILASNEFMTSNVAMLRYEGSVNQLQLISPTQILSNPFIYGTVQGAALLGSNVTVPISRTLRTELTVQGPSVDTTLVAATLMTINLGSVVTGDYIDVMLTGTGATLTTASTDRADISFAKSAGTATLSGGTGGVIADAREMDGATSSSFSMFGRLKVSAGGTLTLAVTGTSANGVAVAKANKLNMDVKVFIGT